MKTNFLSFIVLISGLLLSSCFPKPIDKSTNENSRGNSELNESVSRTPSYIFTSSSTFYWDSGNIVPPSDVMQEIDYFGGGGGGSTVCHDYPSEYSNRCREDGVELMQRIRISLDGLNPAQNVVATITFPDGSVKQENVVNNKDGEFAFYFQPLIGWPLGTYRISFDSATAHLEKNVEVVKPNVPRLYLTGEVLGTEGQNIILYNFFPNEKIRLFAYRYETLVQKLVLWQLFTADENGIAFIKNLLYLPDEYYYAAVGDISGAVYPQGYSGSGFVTAGIEDTTKWGKGHEIFCGGAPNPIPGMREYEIVVISDNVFLEPMRSSKDIPEHVHLPKGTELIIWGAGSPYCRNNAYWWTVKCDEIESEVDCNELWYGAIAEQLNGVQQIRPMDDCGELGSRLSRGMKAVVISNNINIRAHPSLRSDILANVPKGTQVSIWSRRSCVEHATWWKIFIDDGPEGWMAEDQDGEYLLEPYP